MLRFLQLMLQDADLSNEKAYLSSDRTYVDVEGLWFYRRRLIRNCVGATEMWFIEELLMKNYVGAAELLGLYKKY